MMVTTPSRKRLCGALPAPRPAGASPNAWRGRSAAEVMPRWKPSVKLLEYMPKSRDYDNLADRCREAEVELATAKPGVDGAVLGSVSSAVAKKTQCHTLIAKSFKGV